MAAASPVAVGGATQPGTGVRLAGGAALDVARVFVDDDEDGTNEPEDDDDGADVIVPEPEPEPELNDDDAKLSVELLTSVGEAV